MIGTITAALQFVLIHCCMGRETAVVASIEHAVKGNAVAGEHLAYPECQSNAVA